MIILHRLFFAKSVYAEAAACFGAIGGRNFGTSPTGEPSEDFSDYDDHGTHVAGTIGAVGDNGIGVVGVNWRTSVIALKKRGR